VIRKSGTQGVAQEFVSDTRTDTRTPSPTPPRPRDSADPAAATLPLRAITPKPHLDRPLEPRRSSRWERRYQLAAVGGDIGVIVVLTLLGGILGLGNGSTGVWTSWYLAAAVAAVTVTSAGICGAWDVRVLGHGSEEFGGVLRGAVLSLVVVGLVGLAFELNAVRPWVFAIIPAIGVATELLRYGLRRMVHARRRQGRCMRSVLAVGCAQSVAELITRTRRARYSGWTVTGVCTSDGRGLNGANDVLGVPVVGDLDNLSLAVGLSQYRVVAVTPTPELTPKRMHRLAWELEGSGAEMVVDPGLMEIAGPRLHVAPVDGLPLLRVTEPAFTGIARVLKTVVDRTIAGVLVLLLAPILLAVMVAIKADGGPVFFRQVRLGQGGRPFLMVKFRSMVADAERLRADLLNANEGAGPLFKMVRDPRITAVGTWLRRYSLDELPQLFNVLAGSMSLVGPRPPLPEEARGYTPEAQRRLLVKPGMTGLWQVSGRSDLSWEESVRLDLRYVENWSMALDAMILWKTIGAVATGRGAY
jgi:exopolysaccharide biosynthesis polyprenyl glycosylphosphotransferase